MITDAQKREKDFINWLKKSNVSKTTLNLYLNSLRKKIPQKLKELNEQSYNNLFECLDIEYLKELHIRFLTKGDLYDFSQSVSNGIPSASTAKYRDFLIEHNLDVKPIVKNENPLTFKEKRKIQKEIRRLLLLLNPSKNKLNLIFSTQEKGKLNFPHKNLLLKGVPGTGKSHTLEKIIENDLKLKNNPKNICRINIHSASSNADLMQGIGINSNNGQIEYKEKQGLIYNHIKKALFTPNQPFVLILEEIQENSLNELIGDLIYLIEEKKRVTVDVTKFENDKEYDYQEFIEKVLEDDKNNHSIEIPFLVDTSTNYRKMVLPSNLYLFCTSNYRDDKKVIEDNLLRRFDVVEIYPQYQDELGEDVFKSKEVSNFLSELNELIEKQFEVETHPDRYLVGHANWLAIGDEENEKNKKLFYTALLKVLVEFKEIREVDFNTYVEPILSELFEDEENLYPTIKKYLDECKFEYISYKEMVEKLQKEIYSFLK